MARNYPADVHIQNFITQNYDCEVRARQDAYKSRKSGEPIVEKSYKTTV